MGRRKIEIQPITHERNRSVTFLKRKNGLFKKAYELGVLCSVDVAVIIFEERPGHDLKLHQYSSSDIRDIIQRQLRHQGERDAKGPSDFSGSGGKYDDNGDGDDDDGIEEEEEPPARPAKRKATGKAAVAPNIATPTNGTHTAPSRDGRLSGQTPLSVPGVRGFEEGPSSSSVLPVSNDRVSNLRDSSTRTSNKRPRSESDVDPIPSRSPSEDAQAPRSSLFLTDQQTSARGYVRQIRYPHETGPPQDSGTFNHHGPMQPSASHSYNSGYNSMFSDTGNSTLAPFQSSRNSAPQQLQSYSRDLSRDEYFPPRGRFSDTDYDLNSYSNPVRQSPPPSSSMHFSPWPQQQPREGRLDFSAFLEADERSRQQQSLLQSRTQTSGLEWPIHESPRISRGTMGPPVSSMSSIGASAWFDVFSSGVGDPIATANKDVSRSQGTSWERGSAAGEMAQVFQSTKKQSTSRPSASKALRGTIVPDIPPQGGSMATGNTRMQIPDITISMVRGSEDLPTPAAPTAQPMDADITMQPPQSEIQAVEEKTVLPTEEAPPTSSDSGDSSSQPSSRTGEKPDNLPVDSDKPLDAPADGAKTVPPTS